MPCAKERPKLNNIPSSWKLNNHSVNGPAFFQLAKFLTIDLQQPVSCLHTRDVTDDYWWLLK